MIVITGAQRSGTSVIAECLIKSGYDLGADWYDQEVNGGYDSPIVCAFYRDYLGDDRFPFEDMKVPFWPGIQTSFKHLGSDIDALKFCYLTMNPAFVSIWQRFRPLNYGDQFLVMLRDPKDIIQSKRRILSRFKYDSELLNQDVQELARNRAHSTYLLRQLGYQVEYLPFPACLSELTRVNTVLARLDAGIQIKEDVWNQTVDFTKVHY